MCRGFESHPSSSFFFSEKKELFGLVVLPCFIFIGLVCLGYCNLFTGILAEFENSGSDGY